MYIMYIYIYIYIYMYIMYIYMYIYNIYLSGTDEICTEIIETMKSV